MHVKTGNPPLELRRSFKNINEITEGIIGLAIEVHKYLGPGLPERFYEEAFCHELTSGAFVFERQKEYTVPYKDVVLDGKVRVDVLVEDKVIVELKNVDMLQPIHEAQLLTYLKISGKQVGLLLNFNEVLLKNGIKRLSL